jgi:hypothetical protein
LKYVDITELRASVDASPYYWVVQLLRSKDALKGDGSAFQVEPKINNIDALKDAIKVRKSNRFKEIDADELKIFQYNQEKQQWAEILRPDTPLAANTEETAYGVLKPA